MSQYAFICILLFFNMFYLNNATLSEPFRIFLRSRYGSNVDELLSRVDMGGGGSFGGGINHIAGQPTLHRPVILVHGITNTAGTFGKIQHHFLNNNYKDEEVYGTTYGDGGKTNVIFVTMNCHYMKVIRMFIQTVTEYTASQVDVIGYSMGSPIARKAILGGVCVDTREDLGGPLTNLVHTFIGVAGANFGSFLCVFPFGSCNLNNGLGCGSQFLNDINSKQRYEGTFIYTIYSTNDDKVGYHACGKIVSNINGQNEAFVKNGLNHDRVMYETAQLQYTLITKV